MSNILRLDGDAAAIQALVSGQATAVGGNTFYVDRLNEAKPGLHGNKFEFGWSGGGARMATLYTKSATAAGLQRGPLAS